MELNSMVESQMARVVDKMRSMSWQFYVAPDDNRFVTSDNPVHTFKGGVGFSRSYSELTFPLSSRVALLGSFRKVREGYLPAPTQLLKEINRRIIAAATSHVYSSRKERWVVTVLKKELHRFSLAYPAPELRSAIEV